MLLTIKEMEVHHVFMSSLGLAEIKFLVLELCWYFGLQIGSGVPQIGRVQIFNPRVHMIILTINAFLVVKLNIRYPIYFSVKKAAILCLILHIAIAILSILSYFIPITFKQGVHRGQVYFTFDLLFTTVFMGTYGYIFKTALDKWKRDKRVVRPALQLQMVTGVSIPQKVDESVFKKSLKSKFPAVISIGIRWVDIS